MHSRRNTHLGLGYGHVLRGIVDLSGKRPDLSGTERKSRLSYSGSPSWVYLSVKIYCSILNESLAGALLLLDMSVVLFERHAFKDSLQIGKAQSAH